MGKVYNSKFVLDTADAAKSVGDIRKSLKELDSAALNIGDGGKAFDELTKKSAELKDKLEDLKDTTQSLKGSGIEKLNASFGLLKEGFTNFDTGKLKTGFSVLGTAMKAIPIFLLIEGIRYLIENFEKLKNSGGIIGKVFTAIGDVISFVIDKIKEFTDWIGITNFAVEDKAEKTIEAAKKEETAVTERYDAEIKLAKAAGKETFELEILKQKAIIDSAKIQFEAIKAVAVANGEVTQEQTEKVLALGKMIKDANLEIEVKQLEHKKSISDINQKAFEENKSKTDKEKEDKLKEYRKAEEDYDKHLKELRDKQRADDAQGYADAVVMAQLMYEEMDRNAIAIAELKVGQNQKDIQAKIDLLTVQKDIELQNARFTADEKLLIEQNYSDAVTNIKTVQAEKEKQIDQAKMNATVGIANATTDSLSALSDLYFSVKQANTKKGSAEELKAAKQQFKINKALSITSAVISGIQGVVNALSAQSVVPEPFGTVLKVASAVGVGIAAAANVAKIAATQFNPGGGGGGGGTSSSAPSVPSSATPATPANPTLFSTGASSTSTVSSQLQKQPVVKAVVVESDITTTQRRVNSIQQTASL